MIERNSSSTRNGQWPLWNLKSLVQRLQIFVEVEQSHLENIYSTVFSLPDRLYTLMVQAVDLLVQRFCGYLTFLDHSETPSRCQTFKSCVKVYKHVQI